MTAPLTAEQLAEIEARLAAGKSQKISTAVKWGERPMTDAESEMVSTTFRHAFADIAALLADNARLRGLLKDIAAHDYVFDGCRGACAVREEPCGTCWEHDGILAALGKYKVLP